MYQTRLSPPQCPSRMVGRATRLRRIFVLLFNLSVISEERFINVSIILERSLTDYERRHLSSTVLSENIQ